MNEMVKNWLIELYEREIKEALGSISNERIWLMGTDVWEEEKMHLDNYDITIPDENRTGDESEARLYGTEYGDTEDYITQILCHLVQEVRDNPNATINHFEY